MTPTVLSPGYKGGDMLRIAACRCDGCDECLDDSMSALGIAGGYVRQFDHRVPPSIHPGDELAVAVTCPECDEEGLVYRWNGEVTAPVDCSTCKGVGYVILYRCVVEAVLPVREDDSGEDYPYISIDSVSGNVWLVNGPHLDDLVDLLDTDEDTYVGDRWAADLRPTDVVVRFASVTQVEPIAEMVDPGSIVARDRLGEALDMTGADDDVKAAARNTPHRLVPLSLPVDQLTHLELA